MNYNTTLGDAGFSPDSIYRPDINDDIDLSFFMRGGVGIPLHLSLGWETLTFGYAYRLNRDIAFALNLHRHLFSMNFRGRADVDILGTLNATVNAGPLGEMTVNQLLDFPAEMANGYINGRFTATAWTPSVGVRFGRVSLASRFGLNTKAKGTVRGQFIMPDIVNIETGQIDIDLNDDITPDEALDLIDRLSNISVDSIVYESTERLHWKLPQGHTITLDVIPEVFSLSYTKIIGDIEMRLKNILRHRKTMPVNADEDIIWADTLSFDLGVTVDHIIMANLNLFGVFLNLGVFAFDVRSEDTENIVGSAVPSQMRIGKSALLPVLSFGGTLGSKLKLHIEGDVLPLPAVRTGIFYYF